MTIIGIQEKTDDEVFAAAGLVCPNDCPAGTGWTYFELVHTSRPVWVGRVEDAEEAEKGELVVIASSDSEVFWECSENEQFVCDGCNFVVPAADVTHDWE